MDHVEYVYTVGMDAATVDEHLRTGSHGVLALADGDDAYAVPLSYRYDDGRLLLRVSTHGDAGGEKRRYLETTETATFVRFADEADDAWSIQVRGRLAPWDGAADEATLNDWFSPFRLFDEAVADVEFTLYELDVERITGRRTAD